MKPFATWSVSVAGEPSISSVTVAVPLQPGTSWSWTTPRCASARSVKTW
jgi:hypothetical protein